MEILKGRYRQMEHIKFEAHTNGNNNKNKSKNFIETRQKSRNKVQEFCLFVFARREKEIEKSIGKWVCVDRHSASVIVTHLKRRQLLVRLTDIELD